MKTLSLPVAVTLIVVCTVLAQAILEHPKLRKRSTYGPMKRETASRYIVVWKERVGNGTNATEFSARVLEGIVSGNDTTVEKGRTPEVRKWKDNGIGVSAEMNEDALQKVLDMEDVELVEEDMEVYATADPTFYPIELGWHLDRIDQHNARLDGRFRPPFTGRGVDIFILDSGIRYSHRVFGGRAKFGGYDYNQGEQGKDCHGHGTHCAGLAGGAVTGVAPGATIYSIRVLNCQLGGLFSWVVEGIDQVIKFAQTSGRPTVVSMSLIGPKSEALDAALRRAFYRGILMFVAAGNQKSNACNFSPSSSRFVVTVGGSQQEKDKLYWFASSRSPGTNYGGCVQIFAPGQWIRSATHLNDDYLVSNSGTSMASPIAAGVAALILEESPNLSPVQVWNIMKARATRNAMDFSPIPPADRSYTPNLLVYTGQGRTPTSPTLTASPAAPTTGNQTTDDLGMTVPPTTTAPSTTTASPTTTAPPTTAAPPTTRAPTTTTPPSNKTFELISLPTQLNVLVDGIPINSLYTWIISQKKLGYVANSITVYCVLNSLYYGVIFSYVGTGNVSLYLTYKDLTVHTAFNLIQSNKRKGYAVIGLAPYNINHNEPRVTLIFKKDPTLVNTTIVSLEMTISRLTTEQNNLRARGYEMVYRRLRGTGITTSNTLYARIYTIYRYGSRTSYHGSLSEGSLQTYVINKATRGEFLIDVCTFDYRGTQLYHAIFDTNRFGSNIFRTILSTTRSALHSNNSRMRELGYHMTSFVDMPKRGRNYPRYFTAFWRG